MAKVTWSVRLEFEDFAGTRRELEDALDDLMERLAAYDAVAVGPDPAGNYAVRLTVSAPAPEEAMLHARDVVVDAGWVHAYVGGEVVRTDRLARDAAGDLVGISEIAERINVSRQRAHELSRHELFPEPATTLSTGPVWNWLDVDMFLALPRRPGRPLIKTGPWVVDLLLEPADRWQRHQWVWLDDWAQKYDATYQHEGDSVRVRLEREEETPDAAIAHAAGLLDSELSRWWKGAVRIAGAEVLRDDEVVCTWSRDWISAWVSWRPGQPKNFPWMRLKAAKK